MQSASTWVHPSLSRAKFKKGLPRVARVEGEITDSTARSFSKAVFEAEAAGQEAVLVLIDSPGGDVHSLLGMLSVVRGCKVPVCTVVTGFAASAAAVLFACGSPGWRYVGPYARLMLHDISTEVDGSLSLRDVSIEKEEMKRLNRLLFDAVDEACGKGRRCFEKMVRKQGGDLYFSAEDAMKEGLADRCGVPRLKCEVNVRVFVEDDEEWNAENAESEESAESAEGAENAENAEKWEEEEVEEEKEKKEGKKAKRKRWS